jgi:class 3 adenylate cyclase
MLSCPACGQENPPVARFCLACGTPLAEDRERADERRVVSVIFVDLVGFTAKAERLDPEEVRALLAPYHDRVRDEIESFGGVVEKFIGDAVMGIFGAPVAHGDDAERAVRAALVIRDSAEELADGDLQLRIAVNTGEAIVSLGARPALGESMVAGDVVNTAARLQTAAPLNGIVVGEETHAATRHAIAYEQTASVVAKGKEHPVRAWIALHATVDVGVRPAAGVAMVGRTAELSILDALWERTVADRLPHLISVVGPAGVGKTTLTATFIRKAVDGGARALFGRSLPYRESSAYGPLSSQLMRLGGVFESDPGPVVLDKLRTVAGALLGSAHADPDAVAGHLAAIVGVSGATAAPDRDTLFYAVREFLEAVAREQPTILVFEDIHWADPSLLDLVHALAGGVRGEPLLFLSLARPELLDARGDWGSGLPGYTAITLGPLPERDARELLLRRLEDADHVEEFLQVAEGNPLFIEQLVAGIGEAKPGKLPTTIREIVAARLDALPRAERALLLDAAVVGKVFWLDVLQALNGDAADLPPLLEQLERRDLIRREPVSIIEGKQQFAFAHALIRDVAYDLLSRADRTRRHAVVAEFFGAVTGGSSEATGAMARHWRAAGDRERAIEQLVRAAEVAERGWAKDHAAFLYREAFELVPDDDADRKAALRRRLALASSASYHLADVRREGSPQA